MVHLLIAVSAFLALAPGANASVRAKLDRDDEVRFELDGSRLSMTVMDGWRYDQFPSTGDRLFGKRVAIACGTSFQPSRSTMVIRKLRWPDRSSALTVRFERDISRRAKWCLIDEGPNGGADIAFVSFRRPEPGRRLTSGRLADGRRWRLAAWRGERLQPCVSLRLMRGQSRSWQEQSGYCFDDEADREAEIQAFFDTPTCSGETFVFGVTARSAASVTVRLADGSTSAAVLHRRPRGSHVRAQYFVAWLAGPVDIAAVEAHDSENRLIARDRGIDASGALCD